MPTKLTNQQKTTHCVGCHDNYYNNGGNQCWSLGSMKLILRKEVNINQRPPWNQKARKFPSCYHRSQYVYLDPKAIC